MGSQLGLRGGDRHLTGKQTETHGTRDTESKQKHMETKQKHTDMAKLGMAQTRAKLGMAQKVNKNTDMKETQYVVNGAHTGKLETHGNNKTSTKLRITKSKTLTYCASHCGKGFWFEDNANHVIPTASG